VILTLTMLTGHAWAYLAARSASDFDPSKFGFRQGIYLGLLGHLFLFSIAIDPALSTPPWPLFGALFVLTLALTATSLAVYSGELHAAGVIAASIIVFAWAGVSAIAWAPMMVIAAEYVVGRSLVWLLVMRRRGRRERYRTWSWCPRARISRCNAARERISERSDRRTDTTTGITGRRLFESDKNLNESARWAVW